MVCADGPYVSAAASIEDAAGAVADVGAGRAAHRGLPAQALLEVRFRRTVNGIISARHVPAG